MRIPCRPALTLSLFTALHLSAAPVTAQTPAADSSRIARLAAVGQLWVAIREFHPWLGYRPIAWDSALAATVPRVSAATDRAAWSAAVADLLAVLGDPVTRLESDSDPEAAPSPGEPDPRSWWAADSTLVVSLRNPADFADFNRTIDRLTAIADTIRHARRVVFDLRASADGGGFDWALGESGIPSLFAPAPARAPDQRGRLHAGVPPERGNTSGGYFTGFYTVNGAAVTPGDGMAGSRAAVLLVNDRSLIPEALLALHSAGRAVIVAEGGVTDAGVVRTYRWTLPESLHVSLRLTELLQGGGPLASLPDTVVTRSGGAGAADAGLAAALAAFAPHARPLRLTGPEWPLPRAAAGDSAEAAGYPALPYRLLAAFRIWAVGQYFFPYRELMGERWDRVLAETIPRLEAARDSVEYGLALAEMAAHLHDSHVRVTSPSLEAALGTATAPVYLRMIEGQPVITHFTNDTLARRGGAHIGDVILSVDGEDARARMRRLARYISASTPQALDRVAAIRMTRGIAGTTVKLRVRRAGGAIRELELTRSPEFELTGRTGPLFRVLPGNIGYADLGRLPASQVDSMFEGLRETRAIIFDMRGYPLGTAWPIAPRLTRADMPVAARFARPNPLSPDTTERATVEFTQALNHTDQWRYLKPTVMLIDERTLSQAEHTGLFLEAANGTKFVGSPTMGANGDVTVIALPGRVTMSFTGQAVRHADGRQLQRVGLVPDLLVRPTIAGVRAGRDEVLERAVHWLMRRTR
ncbi:MAG TPA: S41 family peptidase [Gemmatimonadales bacterium]|nr:S41 family peptidase [Gemmatimonadales bacterium]